MFHTTRRISSPTKKPDPLAAAGERLRQLAALNCIECQKDWAIEITDAIGKLEIAFRQHRTGARSVEGGVLSEVDETESATVARQADEVRDDHDDILMRIVTFRDEIRHALAPSTGNVDLENIRQRIELLLIELEKSRQAETALLQDTVNTDIGVGD